MVRQGSYDVSEFAVDKRGEIERLKAQVDLFWNREFLLYRSLGLDGGMRLLDCGCGPGHLIARLKSELPDLVCTGIDVDDELVAVAADRLDAVAGCHVLRQSACALDLPDDSFDFVISRLVLEHLPEPAQAAREIFRVLKPGGTAVIVDNDFDLHERTFPDCPSLQELYAAYREARRVEGGNPCIGRELPLLLSNTGFEDVNLQVLAAHSQITGDSAFLRAEGSGIPAQLVKNGYLAAEALERITIEWMRMLEAPDHAIFRVLMAGVGRKPTASHGSQRAERSSTSTSARQNTGTDDCISAAVSTESVTPAEIRRFMQNTLAAEMDVDPDSLDCGEALIHLGVDSIAALHLCNRMKSWLSINLPVAEILCGKSIDSLADDVMVLLGERIDFHQAIAPQPRLR